MKSLVNNIRNMAFVAAAGLVAAACSDYSPEEYDGNLTKEEYKTIVEYTKNFEDRYGKMDPEQDWGFSEFAVEESEGTRSVRETRGKSHANSNISTTYAGGDFWVNVKIENNTTITGFEGYKVRGEEIVVPGFPSKTDGKYYFMKNNQTVSYSDIKGLDWDNTLNGGTIVGDVTNDEIVFVSRWFREHKNPESMTQAQLMDNKDSYAKLNSAEYLKTFSYNTFFVQNISGDKDRYETGGYKNGWPGAGMDNLQVGDMSWHQESQWWGHWEGTNHVEKFNAGLSVNAIDEHNPDSYQNSYSQRQIMLYVGDDGEAVTKFYYHNSQESKYYDRYVVMHLNFTINGLTYDGYYLGFDYETYLNTNWQPDGYYNNWIIKISDALPQSTPEPSYDVRRVMCEDLGNTDDFDFNDLVFDVYFTKQTNSKYTAHLTVKAVGGTLPIYLDYNMSRELHAAMGGDVKQPINVGAQGGLETTNYYETTIENMESPQADDIPIIVVREGGNQSAKISMLPKSTNRETAPQKICVPTTVKWMKERIQIEQGYPGFGKWVQYKNYGNSFWNGNVY